jgi:hypothetical protein
MTQRFGILLLLLILGTGNGIDVRADDDLDHLLVQGPPELGFCWSGTLSEDQADRMWRLLREINKNSNLMLTAAGIEPEGMPVDAAHYSEFYPYRWSCSEFEKILLFALEKIRLDKEALDRFFCPNELEEYVVFRAKSAPIKTRFPKPVKRFFLRLMACIDRIHDVDFKILHECELKLDERWPETNYAGMDMSDAVELMVEKLSLIKDQSIVLRNSLASYGNVQ